ncbi:MAG: ABC transporter permease [Bacteroidales bacterium]|nr:ABC transporter permease [Bacteroidales bacterium]MBR5703503.1 ABC transporter permease [Bacteroidales bacterium]
MILKNLKSLIRRYPVAVVLNFTGLVAAFVAFALIFLQADYELSFDKCHPTADRVFRADKKGDETLFRNIFPRGFADDIISSSAHIEAGCTVMPFMGEIYFSVAKDGGTPSGYKRDLLFVSEGLIDVFGIKMIEGDSHALEGPNSVIIPRSLAENLFPGEPALGKLLKTDAKYMELPREITVTGVYEDFPSNTQLGNDLYLTVGDVQKGSYGGANFICYLLLDDAGSAEAVADEFNSHFDFAPHGDWLTPIELVPLTSIYFRNEGNVYKSGSRSQLLLLIAIAILILAIGLINFTNFYVALTPLRIRNVNLQKILGSSTTRLRTLVVAEAVIWCICAFVVAALLLGPVSEALATQGVLMQSFTLGKHWGLLVFVGTVALATGIIAGIWPGIYSTSGQPALILRGNYGLSQSGKTLRSVLVGVQFVVSIALLIFVLFVQRQSRYMQGYPCGYNKNNLAVVNIGGENGREKADWLRERLCAFPDVEDVAFANDLIGGSDTYSTQGANFGDGEVLMSMIYCSWNLPQVLGLEVMEGRDFNEGEFGPYLLTQDMKTRGAELTESGDGEPIIGFINNVNITSMRKADSPVAFQVHTKKGHSMPFAYIRLAVGADRFAAVDKIKTVLTEMDPTMPYDVQFYESIGKNLYSGEERLRVAVWLFSLLAVLLSLVGIWGQVLMDVQYKRMEISIKRVLGAEIPQITSEGLWIYLRTVAICYVVAAPIGWLIVRYYLQQFSHRVGFSLGVFALTLIIVAALCALVVLSHYLRAARMNPAEVLKKE